jgi:putative intracellular protease/amidase
VLQGGKVVPIGTYLNELVVPVMAMLAAGYEIVLATPHGFKPTIDAHSVNAAHFGASQDALEEAFDFFERHPALQQPRTLQSVVEDGLDAYAGVFVPGGHAPVVDLMQDQQFGEILRQFHAQAKPTALLCHGPIAVIAALPRANDLRAALDAGDLESARALSRDWPYAGYRMTVFSNEEERVYQAETFDGTMTFYVADALEMAGGIVLTAPGLFEAHVVKDRELITGQNPSSDHRLAAALVKALDRQSANLIAV